MIDVLRSEWTKIRSVRSTMWLLVGAVASMLGFSALISFTADETQMSNVDAALSGTAFAALIMAVLGVLVISAEYRTGMIRTTLLAVPQRLRVLVGKAIVLTAVVLAVSLTAAFGAFLLAQAIYGDQAIALTEPNVLRALIGSALYVTAGALFGLGLGTLIRHTAGGVVAIFLMTVLLPQMAGLLPGEWGDQAYRYFTTNAGQQIANVTQSAELLGPWDGFAVYCAWIAVTLIAGAMLLRRRDA